MARSATKRARPTMPPAIPPAMAALFEFGTGLGVWTTDWSVGATVVLLPEIRAGVLATMVDVGPDTEVLELPVEEDGRRGTPEWIADMISAATVGLRVEVPF